MESYGVLSGYSAFSDAQSGIASNMQKIVDSSTTDLMQQIPEQIVGQRAVEANTQSIKTQDSILQTLLDIKA